MPMQDGTGPAGRGPLTGRGLGLCGNGGRMGEGRGFLKRRWFGRGLGRYCDWNSPQTKEEKIMEKEDYLKALQKEIEDVTNEVQTLKQQG